MPGSGHGVVSDQIPEAIEGLKINRHPQSSTAPYYPETNPLVALGGVAEISNTPASKSVVITIEPAPAVAGARRLS